MPRTASPGKPVSHAMDTSVMKCHVVSTTGPRKSQNQVDVSIKGYGITPADKESPDMEKMIRKLTKNVLKIQKQIQRESPINLEKGNLDVVGTSKAKRKKKLKQSFSGTVENIPKIQMVVQQMEHSNGNNIFAAGSKSSHIIEHSSSCSNNKLNALKKGTCRSGSSNRCTCFNNDGPTNEVCSCGTLSAIGLKSGEEASCGCHSMANARSKSVSPSALMKSRKITSPPGQSTERRCSSRASPPSPSSLVKSKKCTPPSDQSTEKISNSQASQTSKPETSNTSIISTNEPITSTHSFAQPFPIELDTSEPLSSPPSPSCSTQKKRKSKKMKSSSQTAVAKSTSSSKFHPIPSPEVYSSYEIINCDVSKKTSTDKLHSPHSSPKPSTKSSHKKCPESGKSARKHTTDISDRKVSEETKTDTKSNHKKSPESGKRESKHSPAISDRKVSEEIILKSSEDKCGIASPAGHCSNAKCRKSSSADLGSRCSPSTHCKTSSNESVTELDSHGKTSSNESMTELDRKTRFLEQFLLCGRSENDGRGSTSTVSNANSDGKSKYLEQHFNCNCDDTTKLDRKSKMVEEYLTCACKSDVNTFSETKSTYMKGYLGCDCGHGLEPSEIQKKMKIIENSLQCNRVESTFVMDDIDKKNTYLNQILKCGCNNEREIDHKGKFIERILTCECNHKHDPDIDLKKRFLDKHVLCDCGSSCPKQAAIKEPTPKASKNLPKTLTPKASEEKLSKKPSKSKIKQEVPIPVPLGQPRVCGDNLRLGKSRLKMPLTKPGWADGKVLLCSCGDGEVMECRCKNMCGSLTSIKRSSSTRDSATKGHKMDEKPLQKMYSAYKSVERIQPFPSSQNEDGLVCGCGKTENAQCICDSLLYSTGSGTKTIANPVLTKTKKLGSEPTITIAVKQKTENGDVHMKLVGHGNDLQTYHGRVELTEFTGGPLRQAYPPFSSLTLSPASSGSQFNLQHITFVKCQNVATASILHKKSKSIEAVKSPESARITPPKRRSSNPLVVLAMASQIDTSLPCRRPGKSGAVSSSDSTSMSCPHLALSVSNSDDYECYVCAANKSRTSNIENPIVMAVETKDENKTPFRSSDKKKVKSSLMPSILLKFFKSKKPKSEERKSREKESPILEKGRPSREIGSPSQEKGTASQEKGSRSREKGSRSREIGSLSRLLGSPSREKERKESRDKSGSKVKFHKSEVSCKSLYRHSPRGMRK